MNEFCVTLIVLSCYRQEWIQWGGGWGPEAMTPRTVAFPIVNNSFKKLLHEKDNSPPKSSALDPLLVLDDSKLYTYKCAQA